ncbi:unnamed protein product [Schistosoma guineensis]|nr:unnamed protein product [Schistosoma guineensis]
MCRFTIVQLAASYLLTQIYQRVVWKKRELNEMSTHGTADGPLEADSSWVSSKTSFMTISDPSDSSTPTANSSLDETFASNKFSPNSFANSSPKSDGVEDNDYDNGDKDDDEEEQVKHKKKTGVTLVYAPEKSANIFKSSQKPIVTPQPNQKVIIIRSNQGNDNNDSENNSLTKENGIGSTTASSIDKILYSSEENLSKLNGEHDLKQLNNSNSVFYNNSLDEFSSNNGISDYKDLSDNNNNNLSDNDSKYDNSTSILSTPTVLTSLDNHNDSSVLSMGSKSLSKEILNDDDNTNNNNSNNNQSYANSTISVDENNDITGIVLQNYEEIAKNTSSIDQNEKYLSALKPVLSSQSNHSIDSDQESKLLTDNSFLKSNLSNIAQMNSELDDEVTKTVLNISDQYKKTVNKFVEQSMPTYLDRCSPAQIVAVTGGAPPDIIRNIEEDLDEDNDNVIEVLNTDVEHEANPSASSSTNPGNIVRQRGHTSPKPVTINIDLRVVSKLTPSTPEEVDASSELVFSNFMIDRYRLEVSASAQASSSQSTASASASIHVTDIGQQAESEDPVSHELSSLPRAEPHSVEAIVARNLAEIGDEINRIYGPRLDRMIKLLPVEECPLEMFYNVARVLFARGPTNWGQVITLFYFGYRLVVQRVKKGVTNAFYQVCRCLVSFCRQINIFVWIAQQGGWRILQFLQSHRTYDDKNINTKNHSTPSNMTSHIDENHQQNTLLNDHNMNNPLFDYSNHDSSLFIPFILTSTSVVVIAVAVWFYLRRLK